MSKNINKLHRNQLDQTLGGLRRIVPELHTRDGWISEIRRALAMSGTQLAKRMRRAPSGITTMEANERRGAITLSSLRRAAEALNCQLVYALVPNQALAKTVEMRARRYAEARVRIVNKTMRLENQGTGEDHLRAQVDDLVSELLRKPPRDLWNDDRDER